MIKTRSRYEEYLNDIYTPEQALEKGAYMKNAYYLLIRGKYGTALREHDPIAFNVGYDEWSLEE